MYQFSIIIPTKDREKILLSSLESLIHATKKFSAEIIVVNDSADKISAERIFADNIRVLQNPLSGAGSARNFGIKNSGSETIIIMDDDMLVSEQNIKSALELHHTFPEDAINLNWQYPDSLTSELSQKKFGRYLHHFGFTTLKGWNKGKHWDDEELFETDGITSQFLIMSKTAFSKAGGYNDKFPYAGFEDFDFSQKLKAAGIRVFIYPLSVIYHNEADRLEIRAWLERKFRGGITRRFAVAMGYTELRIEYSLLKKLIFYFLHSIKTLLLKASEAIPDTRLFDPFYFFAVNLLLGTSIFEGYYLNKLSK